MERRGENHKDPRHLQPKVSWAWEGLAMAKGTIFLHYWALGRSKRNGAGMSVCYLL